MTTHASRLMAAFTEQEGCNSIKLEKTFGDTQLLREANGSFSLELASALRLVVTGVSWSSRNRTTIAM